jgi:hypothetical protein
MQSFLLCRSDCCCLALVVVMPLLGWKIQTRYCTATPGVTFHPIEIKEQEAKHAAMV